MKAMMRPAPTRNTAEPATIAGGLLLRLRAWLASGASVPRDVQPSDAAQLDHATTATLLPFPIHGEALLVKLAELLRNRVTQLAASGSPFNLTISRAARSRLLIDDSSYVEFHPRCSAYHVVVEAAPATTVTIVTTDFDTLVQFVVQYVEGRLAEHAALEVAS
jgi:hypothetical protein